MTSWLERVHNHDSAGRRISTNHPGNITVRQDQNGCGRPWTPPAMAITSAAKEPGIEAIVRGSSGVDDSRGLMLGSVSCVLPRAGCRVLLIR